jgi:hypothetical protein
MSAIQDELERLYELLKETQEERDTLKYEVDCLNEVVSVYKHKNQEQQNDMADLKYQNELILTDNYALKHRLGCLIDINRTTHEYTTNLRKENKKMDKQIQELKGWNNEIKKVVHPCDLSENGLEERKIYLQDVIYMNKFK